MSENLTRRATCQCGQLAVECIGDPIRISTCHCLDCQRRSGSSFAAQARFPAENVTITGSSKHWTRFGDEGGQGDMYFCPTCGSNVFYRLPAEPDLIAVAIGAFADPAFPPPHYSVYESRKHAWVAIVGQGSSIMDDAIFVDRLVRRIRMQKDAVLTPDDDGGYVAYDPETGTASQGDTTEEALANLREAVELYLEELPAKP